MWIDEMTDGGVAADEYQLAEGRARAAGLEEPEETLDRDVDDRLRRLLARRQVQDVRDAVDGRLDDLAPVYRPGDHLDPWAVVDSPVVAERSDRGCREPRIVGREQSRDERLAD